jgi:hypothetical protein
MQPFRPMRQHRTPSFIVEVESPNAHLSLTPPARRSICTSIATNSGEQLIVAAQHMTMLAL